MKKRFFLWGMIAFMMVGTTGILSACDGAEDVQEVLNDIELIKDHVGGGSK